MEAIELPKIVKELFLMTGNFQRLMRVRHLRQTNGIWIIGIYPRSERFSISGLISGQVVPQTIRSHWLLKKNGME